MASLKAEVVDLHIGPADQILIAAALAMVRTNVQALPYLLRLSVPSLDEMHIEKAACEGMVKCDGH